MVEKSSIIIKNGILLDPLNGFKLEKADVLIENGVFVDKITQQNPIIINANNLLVMPGGIDIHTHFAGAKVNLGRILRPDEHRIRTQNRANGKPLGNGWATPTSELCGYLYSKMGYTTLIEPAIAPIKARHTHEEMSAVPFVDKLGLLLLGNNWVVMDCIANNELKLLEKYIQWVLWATKTYGLKLVSPGSVEAWGWGKKIVSIDDPVPFFNVTPREIIVNLAKINEKLNLPHPIHLHANNLGAPGNYTTTIESLNAVKKISKNTATHPFTVHLTHAQFSCYGGESWKTFSSASEELSKYINRNSHVSFDMGQVVFGNITTMTADGAWQYTLHKLTGNRWINTDIEVESGGGVVPYTFHRKNFVNAIQWAIGLELVLMTDDIWKVHLSTDHPNAAPFTSYPVIISWLMSKKSRELMIKKINKKSVNRIVLPSLDRELTLEEIAIITRSAPARTLGLSEITGFRYGNPANLVIYNFEYEKINLSNDIPKVVKGFSNCKLTIKDGSIVVKDGALLTKKYGAVYFNGQEIKDDSLIELLKNYFKKYYSVSIDNFVLNKTANMQQLQLVEAT
ncbi:MAG: formylmethanofuran dehydrogenase subunit A [Candidatus Odinarchaeia archaeon]